MPLEPSCLHRFPLLSIDRAALPLCHPDRAKRAEGSLNQLSCPRDFSARSLRFLGRNDKGNPCLRRCQTKLAKERILASTLAQRRWHRRSTLASTVWQSQMGEVAFCPLGKMTEGAAADLGCSSRGILPPCFCKKKCEARLKKGKGYGMIAIPHKLNTNDTLGRCGLLTAKTQSPFWHLS